MRKGFTLIELLVVISIIGLLSSIILASLQNARERANVAYMVSEIRQIQTAVSMFFTDTDQIPTQCTVDSNCSEMTDPFLVSLGVPGWQGPYFSGGIWNFIHPWGGALGLQIVVFGGVPTPLLVLDDDVPGSIDNNQGRIPLSAMTAIDMILDDGNLNTGYVLGNGTISPSTMILGFNVPIGEMLVIIYNY